MTAAATRNPAPATADPIRDFAGEVAHDFNNLLGVVIANLDLLAEELKSSPASARLVDEAMTAALRGSELARRLLIATRGRTAPEMREPPPSRPGQTAASRGELVLVVDDNIPLRKAVTQELQALGYHTLEAGDGPAALMILNSQPVSLLFTDVVMPGGMSGFDLARLVLARWPAMKALITSAFPELEPTADSVTTGKLRRLAKPYRKDDLAAALREVLDA